MAEACRALDRADLVESAEMGVSELVTNALIHGEPPIGLRVRGTVAHPRVEVLDGSVKPPEPNPGMTDDELLATFGRGLGMVAMCSEKWGAYVLEDGKIVWFEPAAEPSPDADATRPQIYESTSPATGRMPLVPPDDGIVVHFENLPPAVYADWRRHFRDLRRELVLLSLTHAQTYPAATTLSDMFAQFESEVRRVRGLDLVEQAIHDGREALSVTLTVSREAPAMTSQMLEVLELADAFCRNEQLLSLAPTAQQLEFQQWYLSEFSRQATGEAPRAWAGASSVVPPRFPT